VIEPGDTRVQVKRRTLVTDTARKLLIEHRAGYYDLRGHWR